MATGTVGLIYINAMGGYMTTTGTTWDNLKLSLAGATEMPRNIIAHELHEWARMFPNDKMATGSVALICTNAMRGHVLWRSAFQAHRPRLAYPGTAYPVTIASLCSAFQALVLA